MHKHSGLGRLILIATLAIALAIPASLTATTWGTTVEIKSVDNIAGTGNVYTDRPNTMIKIIEFDENKKTVHTWTGTTDANGKLTIPAGHTLSKTYLRAETAEALSGEFIMPSNVGAAEPFMFAVTGAVEGTIVDIKTVEGEVVATKKADHHGRVFLATGLSAGNYLLSASKGKDSNLGSLQIGPKSANFMGDMKVQAPMPALNIDSICRIGTANVDADPSALGVNCLQGNSGSSALTVLAASPHEVVLEKFSESGIKPGAIQLEFRNIKNGESVLSGRTVAYRATGKLSQKTVASGTETHLIVNVLPTELNGTISARVVGGPVSLSNGSTQMSLPLDHGVADFKVQTQPGSAGMFNLTWALEAPWLTNGEIAGSANGHGPLEDDGWVRFVDENGRKGKKRIISDKDGVREEEFKYDDGTYGTWTTTTTKAGKTVTTDSTTATTSEIDTIVEETSTFDKDGNQLTGTRKTWKRKKGGEKTLDKSETWDKKRGWH
jgi:hypothetical protein